MLIDRIVPSLIHKSPILERVRNIQSLLIRVLRLWRTIRRIERTAKTKMKNRMRDLNPKLISAAWGVRNDMDAIFAAPLQFDSHETKDQLFEDSSPDHIGQIGYSSPRRPDRLPNVMIFKYHGVANGSIHLQKGTLQLKDISSDGTQAQHRFEKNQKRIDEYINNNFKAIRDQIREDQKIDDSTDRVVASIVLSISLECDWLPSRASLVPGIREFMHLQIGNHTNKFEMWRGRGTRDKLPLIRVYASHLSLSRDNTTTAGDQLGSENDMKFIDDLERVGMCGIEDVMTSSELTHTEALCIQFPTFFNPDHTAHTIYPACLGLYPGGSRLVVVQRSLVEFPQLTQNLVIGDKDALLRKDQHPSSKADEIREIGRGTTGDGKTSTNDELISTRSNSSFIEEYEGSFIQQLGPSTPSWHVATWMSKSSQPKFRQRKETLNLPIFDHKEEMAGYLRPTIEKVVVNQISETYDRVISDPKYEESSLMAHQITYDVSTCEPFKNDWYSGGFRVLSPGTVDDMNSCKSKLNGAPIPDELFKLIFNNTSQ